MGQRLVVDIIKNNEKIASIYYHGGAYFDITIGVLTNLTEYILDAERKNKDVLLGIIEGVEKTGGCLRGIGDPECIEDYNKAKELFPEHEFKTEGSRYYGIFTFTKEGMEAFADWGEGFAEIEIDTHKIRNSVTYEGDQWLQYDDTSECVDENGKFDLDRYFTSAIVEGCSVNPFEMTCETIFELARHIGITEE